MTNSNSISYRTPLIRQQPPLRTTAKRPVLRCGQTYIMATFCDQETVSQVEEHRRDPDAHLAADEDLVPGAIEPGRKFHPRAGRPRTSGGNRTRSRARRDEACSSRPPIRFNASDLISPHALAANCVASWVEGHRWRIVAHKCVTSGASIGINEQVDSVENGSNSKTVLVAKSSSIQIVEHAG